MVRQVRWGDVRLVAVRHGKVRHGRCGTFWHGKVMFVMFWFGRFGAVVFRMTWLGSVRFVMARQVRNG